MEKERARAARTPDPGRSSSSARLRELAGASFCSHPVRLHGSILDTSSGELTEATRALSCKDRRAVVCPACAALYKDDAFHLVAAGLVGGKGVPRRVATHPLLFATLTAPSFGAVHTRRDRPGGIGTRRPRAASACSGRTGSCGHGAERGCRLEHGAGDEALGTPICPQCFDYAGAVLFNAHVSLLWQRTATTTRRLVGRRLGVSEKGLRSLARLSYIKVAEFQRRGLVHLHLVLRCDGPDGPGEPPPAGIDAALLDSALREAVASTSVAVPATRDRPGDRVRWGREIDVQDLHAGAALDPAGPGAAATGVVDGAGGGGSVPVVDGSGSAGEPIVPLAVIAAYVAKYTVKTVDDAGALAHPVRSLAEIERLEVPGHLRQLVATAWSLGADPGLEDLKLRRHAHTLGYGGHATSKSLVFSTTFGALREARATWRAEHSGGRSVADGPWRYAGRGYLDPGVGLVADRLAELMRSGGRR